MNRALAEPGGNRAGQLTHHHSLVGRAQPRLRPGGDLVLARAVLGEEGVGFDPGRAHRRQQRAAERPLPAQRIQRIGRACALFHPRIDQLLLEAGEQLQPELRPQRRQAAGQEAARAAFPRLAPRGVKVAEQQRDGGRVRHRDGAARRRVGHQHEVARRAERRVVDRSEHRQQQVAGRDADTAPHAARQLRQRHRLAAQQPGQVAGADEGERLRRHASIRYSRAALSWNSARCSAAVYSAATSRKRSHSAA